MLVRSLFEVAEMGEAEETSRGEDAGVVCFPGGDWRASEAFPTSARAPLIDEVLRAEASRGKSLLWIKADEEMQDREDPSSMWDESNLLKFSKALGFATEGVEGEILKLLLRLKTRRDQGKKKGLLGLTRFDREVKKLEWSVNYDGKTRKKGVVRSLGVGRFLEWGALNARGAARGVVVYWDSRVLALMGMEVGLFSISCRFKNCEDGFRWIFSGVYGSTMKRNRELLWEELGDIQGLWNDPWCIGGDFNMIRFPNEWRRGGRLSPSMRRFSEVIDDLDLRDLPLQGGPFTWSGGLNNQAMSRLDRFLVSEDWEGHFNGVVQSTLPRPVSNHFPILLDGGGVRRGLVPFRFENMWLKEEGFKDLLKGWWQGLRFSGSFTFILAEKLKALKAILKSWNKLVFGKVGVNKRLALDKVDFWDSQEKMRTLSLEELEARKEAKGDFEKWALMEEISWRQKSREVWLREGDRNTGFFHKMANSHRRRSCLSKIKINGNWLTEEQDINGGVVGAFENLLTDPGDWHPSMEGLDFNRIDGEDGARLEGTFDIRKGGLGVRRLTTLNRALLCKWNWRFANEREALWRQVIGRKFGEEQGGWYTREVREGFGVGLWKEIRKEGALLQNKVVFSVGNGRRVKFWNDNWCGNFSLSNLFPSLYAFASIKEAWLEELWDHSGDEGVWNPSFSRSFNDWEVEEVERLLLTIRGRRLNPLLEDRMLWKETKDGIFSVKSLYSSLASRRDVQFPYSNIWSTCVPTKVSFFAWEAYWGKVLTLDQLKKRGRSLANRCFLCGMEEESIDHILIQCSKARGLWELLFALFGVTWVLPSSVRDTLSGWSGFKLGKKHRKVWNAAPLCIFWAVWKERNRIAFDNEELSIHRLKNSFVCNLWLWTKSVVNDGPIPLISFFDWLGTS
ncbi:putative ribonuclease H protein [Vitis vinifera]|uniref:Putative ribonuclease H protein n=1 Tax=Vitis vinifera TaxID=29760 RepID=A0A438HXB1_VITVI|nr:putative ribonuclease H protein [Vitis vinifera]